MNLGPSNMETSSVRILVVEDFEPFRILVRAILEKNPRLHITRRSVRWPGRRSEGHRSETGFDSPRHRTSPAEWTGRRPAHSQARPGVQNSLHQPGTLSRRRARSSCLGSLRLRRKNEARKRPIDRRGSGFARKKFRQRQITWSSQSTKFVYSVSSIWLNRAQCGLRKG